jgi:hypothetical protein
MSGETADADGSVTADSMATVSAEGGWLIADSFSAFPVLDMWIMRPEKFREIISLLESKILKRWNPFPLEGFTTLVDLSATVRIFALPPCRCTTNG